MKNTKQTACKKPCKKDELDPIKLDINWGWQIDGILIALVANIVASIATALAIFLRK